MGKVIFHDAAREEFVESFCWYFERGGNIAEAFEHEVERALGLLLEAPERWSVYVVKWRRILLRRFPFALIYSHQAGVITVIAVMHTRRRPGYWKKRKIDVVPSLG
jgi:plasmid stabilization system protein ParE